MGAGLPHEARAGGRGEEEFAFLREQGFVALLFDWDGVLIDSVKNYYRAYELVFADEGIVVNPREIYLREGQPTPQLLGAIFESRGVPVDDATIKKMVERRREYDIALGERKFFAGVPELLGRLRLAGLQIAMVTGSSRKSVERVLLAEQKHLFDGIVTADDTARAKPDPDPFLRAAEMLGVSPSECLVIENAPFGIEAGRSAGCGVAAIATTLPAEDLRRAHWVVQNHGELRALFCGGESPAVGARSAAERGKQ